MKTKEELNALKDEIETLNKKLAELSEEELLQVCGGVLTAGKDEYENVILGSVLDSGDDRYRNAKTRTGDTRGELTPEQRTSEYIHRQIFGKKFDEFFGD